MLGLGYSITCMFAFRRVEENIRFSPPLSCSFLQTTKHPLLKWASDVKIFAGSFLLAGSISFVLVLLPLHKALLSNRELHDQMRASDAEAYSHMVGHVCIGANVSGRRQE